MKVTVITSSYNQGQFAEECFASVLNEVVNLENGLELEHIVIDACSTDGTVELLERWKTSKHLPGRYSLTYVSEPDKGQTDAFNKGVALATGDWVLWLNVDDAVAPGSLRAFLEAIRNNPEADVVYGHVQFIDEASQPIKVCYHLPYFYALTLYGCYIPPSSGTFFRREWLEREPLGLDYHYIMDVEWFLRCGERLKTVLVDMVFSHFRISQNNKTSSSITKGEIKPRHAQEQQMCREKFVYGRWPELSRARVDQIWGRRQKLCMFFYYLLKLRHLFGYLRNRFHGR